jgi:hypothetical protein
VALENSGDSSTTPAAPARERPSKPEATQRQVEAVLSKAYRSTPEKPMGEKLEKSLNCALRSV